MNLHIALDADRKSAAEIFINADFEPFEPNVKVGWYKMYYCISPLFFDYENSQWSDTKQPCVCLCQLHHIMKFLCLFETLV